MLINKLQLNLVAILLVLIPFHTLLIVNILDLPLINLWKELILVILLALYTLNFSINGRLDFIDVFIISTIGYFILITSFSFFTPSALYGLRNLTEPLLFLLIVKNLKISESFFKRLLRFIVLVAFFISLFGIFQCLYLGDHFLLDLGYSRGSNGMLHHSFYFAGGLLQRNIATFSSPNDLGFFLVIVIVMLDSHNIFQKKTVLRLINIVLYFSLFLTFSRSAMLGLVIYHFLNNIKRGLKIICLVIIVFSLINFFFSDALFSIRNFLSMTLSGKDPSIRGHIDSLLFSISLIKENFIFGLQMGRVGPKASMYFNTLIDVESSFFCLLLDVGFIGFCLYITSIFSLMKKKLVLLLLVSVFPALFLLPMIYELEVMLILYGFIGLISIKKQ